MVVFGLSSLSAGLKPLFAFLSRKSSGLARGANISHSFISCSKECDTVVQFITITFCKNPSFRVVGPCDNVVIGSRTNYSDCYSIPGTMVVFRYLKANGYDLFL